MIRKVKTKAMNTRERKRERERGEKEREIKWVEYSYINPFSYN